MPLSRLHLAYADNELRMLRESKSARAVLRFGTSA